MKSSWINSYENIQKSQWCCSENHEIPQGFSSTDWSWDADFSESEKGDFNLTIHSGLYMYILYLEIHVELLPHNVGINYT